jgi:hypothetical protein
MAATASQTLLPLQENASMTAADFLSGLFGKLQGVRSVGAGKQLTELMYPILYEIGREAGYEVNCKPFEYRGESVGYKELSDIDFMFQLPHYDADGWIRFLPDVVFEHENALDFPAKRADFAKACFCVAPLRVFVGYCKTKAEAEEQAEQLARHYSDHKWRQLVDGETLILISWNGASGDDWIGLSLRGESSKWQPISGPLKAYPNNPGGL